MPHWTAVSSTESVDRINLTLVTLEAQKRKSTEVSGQAKKEPRTGRAGNVPQELALALTICLPRATAACTFLREPSFSSNTSADQMAQLTCVHSFCPIYSSRPAS